MRATRWSMAYHDSINEIKEKDARRRKKRRVTPLHEGKRDKEGTPRKESQQAETENAMGL